MVIYNIKTKDKEYSVLSGIKKYEIDFFLNHIKNHTIFGIPIKFDQNLGIPLDQVPVY